MMMTPEEHYNSSMELLESASGLTLTELKVPLLMESLIHMVGAAVRDALDYTAKNPQPVPVPPGPSFEEDEDRP